MPPSSWTPQKSFDANGDDLLDSGNAAVLRWETCGNVNAAEKTLGVDLDGLSKHDAEKQFTTVVYGDSSHDGVADFAVALIGTKTVDQADFGNTMMASEMSPAASLHQPEYVIG